MDRNSKGRRVVFKKRATGAAFCIASCVTLALVVVYWRFETMTLIPALLGISCLLMLIGVYYLNIGPISRVTLRRSITGTSLFIVATSILAIVLGTL